MVPRTGHSFHSNKAFWKRPPSVSLFQPSPPLRAATGAFTSKATGFQAVLALGHFNFQDAFSSRCNIKRPGLPAPSSEEPWSLGPIAADSMIFMEGLYPTVIGSSKEKRYRYMKNAWTESKPEPEPIIGGNITKWTPFLAKRRWNCSTGR